MPDVTSARADESAYRRSLKDLVRRHPAPVFLVRLSDTLLLEASDSLLAVFGRTRDEVLTLHVVDLVLDPENGRRALDLLAAGTLDSYSRRVKVRRPDGGERQLDVRFTTCFNPIDRFAAIGEIVGEPRQDLVGAPTGMAPDTTALGTVDGEWRLDRVTSEVKELLGVSPRDLLGQSAFTAVHPEDVATILLLAAQAAGGPSGAAGRVRLRDANGAWLWRRISLHELVGGAPGSFAFSISGEGEAGAVPAQRMKELEEHLRRIAREIASSGVAALSTAVPTSLEAPQISNLSAREYEILVRLAHGDRVSAIARALFISESTVRNHLTSIYRTFGVGSQAELLDHLNKVTGRPPG